MSPRKSSLSGYNKLKLITVHLPENFLADLDELVKRRKFPSRSEAIRAAVRELIRKYRKRDALLRYHLRKGMIIG